MPGVPNQYYFGLFIAPPGTTDPRAFIFTGVYATNTAQAGIIDGGSGLAVTNWPVGQSMSFLVRGWPASFGHDWATVEPGYCTECLGGAGVSTIATKVSGTAAAPLVLFGPFGGLRGFSMLEAAPVGPDTPDFQNLDFEQMAICPTNGSGLFDTALPFWTCYGMAGTNPLSGVLYNNFCLGSACISLHGPFDPWPVDSGVRHGSFYVYLQAGLGANGHDHLTTTIAQSGIVPANARSLLLNASWGGLEVSFNGTPIPMRTLTSGGGYYVLSGNVGPYAGQFGELRFTAPWVWYQNIPMQGPIEVALDYIRFSALPPVGLPSISTQPFSQTAEAGLQVQLAVRASGELPLVYRWIFNETNVLSISTNSFLELTNVDVSLAGSYTVVVTNAVGAVTSAPAMLNVIAPVQRRMVPRLTLSGQLAMPFNLEHSETLAPTQYWTSLVSMDLTNSPGFYFDLASPLPPQRFYRAWQVTMPTNQSSLGLNMIPAITLTGSPGNRIRVEGINQFGPTDAWFTLAAVTLTNTSQLYFDVTAPGQPARLYRLVPVP